MKELVYANGTQVTPEDAEDPKKKKMGSLDLIAMITGAVAAFEALADSDLSKIAESAMKTVKNPYLVVGLIAAYAFMVVGHND